MARIFGERPEGTFNPQRRADALARIANPVVLDLESTVPSTFVADEIDMAFEDIQEEAR